LAIGLALDREPREVLGLGLVEVEGQQCLGIAAIGFQDHPAAIRLLRHHQSP